MCSVAVGGRLQAPPITETVQGGSRSRLRVHAYAGECVMSKICATPSVKWLQVSKSCIRNSVKAVHIRKYTQRRMHCLFLDGRGTAVSVCGGQRAAVSVLGIVGT